MDNLYFKEDYLRENYKRHVRKLQDSNTPEDEIFHILQMEHPATVYGTISDIVYIEQANVHDKRAGYPIRKIALDKRFSNYTVGKIYTRLKFNKHWEHFDLPMCESSFVNIGKKIRNVVKRADKYTPDFISGKQKDVGSFRWYVFYHLTTEDLKQWIAGKGVSKNAETTMMNNFRLNIVADIILMYKTYITKGISDVAKGTVTPNSFRITSQRYLKLLKKCTHAYVQDKRMKGDIHTYIGPEVYCTIVADIDKDIKRANKWNEHPQDCWDLSNLWWVSGALRNVLDLAAREHYSTALYYTSSKYKAFEPESYQPRYPLFNLFVYTNKEIFEKNYMDDLKDISVPLNATECSPYRFRMNAYHRTNRLV